MTRPLRMDFLISSSIFSWDTCPSTRVLSSYHVLLGVQVLRDEVPHHHDDGIVAVKDISY